MMLTLFLILLLLNIFYGSLLNDFRKVWSKTFLKHPTIVTENLLPEVSVIIPFRNEVNNIENLINQLSKLDYPTEKLSFIFVDDNSDDQSHLNFSNIKLKFPFTVLTSNGIGKKAALQTGVEFAQTNWIVTTDADIQCEADWLKQLFSVEHLDDLVMICGVVMIHPSNIQHEFLFEFQKLEFSMLQAAGAASLHLGNPLLNSGANLAFQKKYWEKIGGYKSHAHIASGDDTFLMLEFSKVFNSGVIPNSNALIKTNPVESWKSLYAQRVRWSGKTKYYKDRYIQLVGMLILFASLPLPFMLFCLDDIEKLLIFLTTISIRFHFERQLLLQWNAKFSLKDNWFSTLKMSLFYPIFLISLVLISPLKRISWKGRRM
jgi:cellulose synthase/poly-beta-1,6-N-acetylglucosamine synthase-like glycosyltransferase